ncbi:Protein KTI12 -like protein [Capsicum baccatum]|uniref:Protein KTI12-like protein n=1 Tax=Capsicum baccatum TaxID=33114 RepID=A0A2G2WA44_CAPBA|nr:Protein KTI12 -like protein [Capsicum baccatum]
MIDVVTYSTEKVNSEMRDAKIPQLTIATQSAFSSKENSLYEMDRTTQEITNPIMAESHALGDSVKEREYALKERENEDRDEEDEDDSPITGSKLRYRVEWSILRQRLDIPNPQYPSLCIALDFVSHSQAVNLVSLHEDGYEILALGVGSDQTTYRWRDVNIPNFSHEKRDKFQIFFRMGVVYCIWHVQRDHGLIDVEIDVLDMVNETYIAHTIIPRGCLTNAYVMDCDGRLSFVEQVKNELHALVLNVNRKLRWEKWIFKLNFLKPDNKELMTFVAFADSSFLFLVKEDKISFCAYDIITRKIIMTHVFSSCFNSPEELTDVIKMMMFHRNGGSSTIKNLYFEAFF